jgi:GAF domain-containing protein
LREIGIFPVVVDLEKLPHATDNQFIAAFASALSAFAPALGQPTSMTTERELQTFLQAAPAVLACDVTLLIDHMEVLPVNRVVLLLRVLRAVLNETTVRKPPFAFRIVATSTFALADISLGPVSPFNLVPPIWIKDLSKDDTLTLVERFLIALRVTASPGFTDEVYRLTNGDRYAIARLCVLCAERATPEGVGSVTTADLAAASRWFADHAAAFPPFQETRRSLEHDSESLLAVAQILDQGIVAERDLPIPIAHPDRLRLTGAVKVDHTSKGTTYSIRSALYNEYLSRYFHPARISRVLFVAGCFDDAVDYLRHRPNLRSDRGLRNAFLDSITGTIFAAGSIHAAVGSLAAYVEAAFDVSGVVVYLLTPDRATLLDVSRHGFTGSEPGTLALDVPSIARDCYVSANYVMDGDLRSVAMPMIADSGEPLGVVVVHGALAPRAEDFEELLAFVRRVGKALGRVTESTRRIEQLEALQTVTREVAKSVGLDEVLRRVVEEGINAIGGAQRGALLLYDHNDKQLHVREQRGYRETFSAELIVDPDGNSYAAAVFRSGLPALIPDAQGDPRVTMRHDADIAMQRAALCVQLAAWGRRLGVFCVDNVTAAHVFQESASSLLASFAVQAAMAIQNALVNRELYLLSMAISDADLHAADIFRRVVQSIVRVTAAEAANMVLPSNLSEPGGAGAQRPEVYAYGMGPTFERVLRPRVDGLTARVFATRHYVIVPSTGTTQTLNDAARKEGVAATIALPLVLQQEVRGVLFVNFKRPHTFLAEEIDLLNFYANICAVAIGRVRQEERRLHASVAWMGLDLSEMGHEITQVVARLQANLHMIARRIRKGSGLSALIEAATRDAIDIANIPKRALVAGTERVELFDLRRLVRHEAAHWCEVHSDISLDLTALDGPPAVVAADPGRIAKVIKTLMQNAVRAAKKSRDASITVSAFLEGRIMNVVFSNSGAPIPREVAEQRLFREPVRSPGQGQGVGLLIARAIVFGYAGDIKLTSSDERRTVFTLSLPLIAEAPAGDAAK